MKRKFVSLQKISLVFLVFVLRISFYFLEDCHRLTIVAFFSSRMTIQSFHVADTFNPWQKQQTCDIFIKEKKKQINGDKKQKSERAKIPSLSEGFFV